ncbi:hypothetical protein ACP4OV_004483 [Aristida adscensionis]
MAGGNMFGRVLSYVVNEFLVEGLANKCEAKYPMVPLAIRGRISFDATGRRGTIFYRRAFQRFAVKTNKTLENLSSKAKEMREELSEQMREARGRDDVTFQAVKLVQTFAPR